MGIDTSTMDRIKSLRSTSAALAGFHAGYEAKYAPDKLCDKKGFGFNRDDRFSAFKLSISFDSWHGYYGGSSCSRILSVDPDAAKLFIVKALEVHQREIFATAARLMREEAAALTGKASEELARLQEMLAEAIKDAAPADAAARAEGGAE